VRASMPSPVLIFDSEDLSNYTCYLARGLSKYRDVILYCFSESSYVETGLSKEKKIKFHYLKKSLPKGYSTMRGIARAVILFFLLSVILVKTNYGIVHIQENFPMFFFFIPFLKLRKKKIFWTIHDVEIFAPSANLHGRLQVLYTKAVSQRSLLAKYADAIIVHALSLKAQLIAKKVNQNKIHVIYHFDYNYLLKINDNGPTINSVDNGISSQERMPEGYALFFGSIAPWKGIDVLMESASMVSNLIGEKFNLVIAGTTPDGYQSHFDNLIKGRQRYIHLINRFIQSNDIPKIIANSKFLILPYNNSFQYSVSGVIPLAYTFSKPVIVSNVESLAEYVEHNKTGFIFESGDSTQLANYMLELIKNDDKCIEMGNKAHQKLLNEMSLELCCKKINDLYFTLEN
jgi:glycosyltransferase involved in cell wall biosynthesis